MNSFLMVPKNHLKTKFKGEFSTPTGRGKFFYNSRAPPQCSVAVEQKLVQPPPESSKFFNPLNNLGRIIHQKILILVTLTDLGKMSNYKIKNIHQPWSPLNQKLNLNSKTERTSINQYLKSNSRYTHISSMTGHLQQPTSKCQSNFQRQTP